MIFKDETISIGLIDGGTVSGDFSFNLLKTFNHLFSIDKKINSIFRVSGLYVPENRNRLIEEWMMSENTTDWILLLDSDIIITPQDVLNLCKIADKEKFPIVTGIYFILRHNNQDKEFKKWVEPCIYTGNFRKNNFVSPILNLSENSFIPIDYAGLGITLIHKKVFEKILEYKKDNIIFDTHLENNFYVGEDIYFYQLIKDIGITPYCYTKVAPKHLKTFYLDLEYYLNIVLKKSDT